LGGVRTDYSPDAANGSVEAADASAAATSWAFSRVRNTGEPGELTHRNFGLFALLSNKFADRGPCPFRLFLGPVCNHIFILTVRC
jgi:hypothetical protein